MARAKVTNVKISLKESVKFCKHIKGMKVSKAKRFLQDLIDQKVNIDGKYYTNIDKTVLKLLKSAEANAKKKGMNESKLWIKNIKADKGMTFILPKSRSKFAGRRGKMTHLTIELEER